MRCYDAILASALALQLRQYDRNFSGSRELLSEFSNVTLISAASQEQMRLMKNRLNSMVAVLRAYKRLMTSQLDDDADMALMNLSILKDNPFLYTYPLSEDIIRMHELTETLLETYLRDLISVEMKLNTLKLQIQAAEELVSLRLDTSRNQLLIVDVAISTCALGVCLGAYIGSIFGMNLQSGIEETPHVFTVVSVLSAVLSIAVIGFVGWYLQHTRIVPFQMMNFFAKNEVAPKSSMFRHRQTLMSADTLHYGNAGVGSSSSSLSPTRSKDVSVL